MARRDRRTTDGNRWRSGRSPAHPAPAGTRAD